MGETCTYWDTPLENHNLNFHRLSSVMSSFDSIFKALKKGFKKKTQGFHILLRTSKTLWQVKEGEVFNSFVCEYSVYIHSACQVRTFYLFKSIYIFFFLTTDETALPEVPWHPFLICHINRIWRPSKNGLISDHCPQNLTHYTQNSLSELLVFVFVLGGFSDWTFFSSFFHHFNLVACKIKRLRSGQFF